MSAPAGEGRAPAAGSALRPVSRNLVWLVAGEVVVKGAVVVAAALVAQGKGAAGMGAFTVALGAVLVATPLLAVGQVEVLIREAARAPDRARALLAGALRGQRRVLAFGALPVIAAVALLPDRPLRYTLLALLPYVWLRVETLTRGAAFKGLDRMDVEVRARGLETGTAVVLVAGLVALDAPVWTVGGAFSAGGAAGLTYLAHRTRELPGGVDPAVPAAALLCHGLPFMAIGALFQLLLRSDVFALEALGFAPETIGFYGAAATLVWGVLAAAQLLAVALYPTASRVAGRGGTPGRTALLAGGAGLAVGLAGAVALVALRRPLLGLVFGREFVAPGAPILAVLAWALPAAGASMVLGVVVAAWHRQRLGLALLVAVLVSAVALELWWIPAHGPAGAARAVVAAHAVAAAGNLLLAGWPGRLRGGEGP